MSHKPAPFNTATDNFADLKEHRLAAAKDCDAAAARLGVAASRVGDSTYGDALLEAADTAAELAKKLRALAERE